MPHEFDVVVVGGGVVGCSIARALAGRTGRLRVALVEKESTLAAHTSGRNSGVIHSGFHLKPGTLRARLCVAGARRLKRYCRERSIPLLESGTLLLATSERDIPILRTLEERGRANTVTTRWVEAREIRGIEPYAAGLAGLHAPEDAILDPKVYVATLAREAVARGVSLILATRVVDIRGDGPLTITTNRGLISAKFLINCAGAHSLKIARLMGLGHNYTMVPFRGEYYELPEKYGFLVRSAVYPAPDLRLPFLGVHLTKTTDGRVLVGPNAVPAFGPENYSWSQTRPGQVLSLLASRAGGQLMAKASNITFAFREMLCSLSKTLTIQRARRLVPHLRPWMAEKGFSGVRPQLVDRWGRLVDDLVLVQGETSLHILNAISPALTASLELADYVVDLLTAGGFVGG